MSTPMRLGFAVKVLGKPGLPSNDARRHQSGPHLRVSLGYLRPIFEYLRAMGITMYRMSSDLAPYLTHPDLPAFHNQVAECRDELADVGRLAASFGLRLSFHPSQYILLNSPDPRVTAQSVKDIDAQARMLDLMGQGPEGVVVTHVGGTYGDKEAGRRRWAEAYRALPEPARRRLVLENDDTRYSSADVLAVHEMCGVPLVFDHQHHWCLNPEGLEVRPTVERFVRTWQGGVRPKIHFSSPRTEGRQVKRKSKETGKAETAELPPIWTGHADYLHPFEWATFLRLTAGLEFDVMIEAKSKDLALLRARRDVVKYAPEQAARFGLAGEAGEEDEEAGEME